MARFANHLFLVTLAVALATSLCLGQSTNAAQPGQASTQPSSPPAPSQTTTPAGAAKGHGIMPVELTKSLDSKKLKEGDPVTGRIAADLRMKDGTAIPRGSKVTGHVTEAKARSKGDPQSALGIIFDKISLPGGKDLAIKGEIQAVAPSPNVGRQDTGMPPMMASKGEGSAPGTSASPQPTMPENEQTGRPILNAQSKGVLGIHNLQLGENSVLSSTGKNVSLDSGTQLMLQVEVE
ncbi:MAG: hypothetical protein WBQ76_15550 [Candidatus Korobacteraceae bacterium]